MESETPKKPIIMTAAMVADQITADTRTAFNRRDALWAIIAQDIMQFNNSGFQPFISLKPFSPDKKWLKGRKVEVGDFIDAKNLTIKLGSEIQTAPLLLTFEGDDSQKLKIVHVGEEKATSFTLQVLENPSGHVAKLVDDQSNTFYSHIRSAYGPLISQDRAWEIISQDLSTLNDAWSAEAIITLAPITQEDTERLAENGFAVEGAQNARYMHVNLECDEVRPHCMVIIEVAPQHLSVHHVNESGSTDFTPQMVGNEVVFVRDDTGQSFASHLRLNFGREIVRTTLRGGITAPEQDLK